MATSLGSIFSAGPEAQAAVIKVTGSPVSLSLNVSGATAYWDVDGDNLNDFRLWSKFFSNPSYTYYNQMYFASDGSNGRGLVGLAAQANDRVLPLATGFQVGPALATGASWGAGADQFRIMYTYGDIADGFAGFQQGDNYFGFRFEKNAALYYGYAVINLDTPSRKVSISKWAYETQSYTALTIQSFDATEVPAPIGLAGLAAGAAWTRKLRRRIRQSAEAT